MICNTYIQFFQNLSDPTKLEIIKLLREGSKSVNEICKQLKFEQSRVSHTLKKLKEMGFVTMTPKGKQRIYGLDTATILPLLRLTDKHVDAYYKHYCKCKGITKKERWASTV
ncbi:winged helix-turn-helix transcriptional regulator [Candidatus Woesearchaeota archaeon]|nr:winged helix-turn-helix transcriptional regulator [Candidatus Woesearchaeota archaeon]